MSSCIYVVMLIPERHDILLVNEMIMRCPHAYVFMLISERHDILLVNEMIMRCPHAYVCNVC